MPRNLVASRSVHGLQVSSLAFSSNDMDSAIAAGYPATTKKAAGLVKGIHTDVAVVGFADKLLITITQEGRLAQWVQAFLFCSLFLFF